MSLPHWCVLFSFSPLQQCAFSGSASSAVTYTHTWKHKWGGSIIWIAHQGSVSLMFPSPSSGQTKTGPADLDRFASFILTSVKSRQTHALGSIRRSRSSGPQSSYVFVARLSDTDDIFKQEQQVLPLFSTYRRKPSCCYWCYSEFYMDRLK